MKNLILICGLFCLILVMSGCNNYNTQNQQTIPQNSINNEGIKETCNVVSQNNKANPELNKCIEEDGDMFEDRVECIGNTLIHTNYDCSITMCKEIYSDSFDCVQDCTSDSITKCECICQEKGYCYCG